MPRGEGAPGALTRQHATGRGAHGIGVNVISPAFVPTVLAASLLADEEFHERLADRIPPRRIAGPWRAVPVLFFCSDANSFVTGQIVTLGDGLTATQ